LVGLTRRASADGLRVGILRIFRALEELKLPATILLNSLVCENYPDVVERIKQRGDEVCNHGADLIKEAGYKHSLGWPVDDQPIWMRTRAGPPRGSQNLPLCGAFKANLCTDAFAAPVDGGRCGFLCE
jgi:hypothetical protein